MLNLIIAKAKCNYEKETISNISNDSRKLWDYIDSKVNTKPRKTTKIRYLKNENSTITDNMEIADSFNKFFVSVGAKLSSSIMPPINRSLHLPTNNPKTIWIESTTFNEIERIISQLKVK